MPELFAREDQPQLGRMSRVPRRAVLGAAFYGRETLSVAVDLLGKILLVRDPRSGHLLGGRIVETEAYSGTDPASHSSRGKTVRCAPMFESPGRAYVYFTYGMYHMLNFVTEPVGSAGAVLIRAIEPEFGIEAMALRRKGVPAPGWTNGPGKLCRALGITGEDNRNPLQGPRIYVLDSAKRETSPSRILRSPRVGISQATDAEWRFFFEGNPWVSRVKENRMARRLRRAVK